MASDSSRRHPVPKRQQRLHERPVRRLEARRCHPYGGPQAGQHGAGAQGLQGSGEGLPAAPGGQVIVGALAMGTGHDAHPHEGTVPWPVVPR